MTRAQDPLQLGLPGLLEVEERFSIVPEWLLYAEISDRAVRLYAVLLRYGNTSGQRMPGRATLSRRMHCSVDSVDRAIKELERLGALEVHRDLLDNEQRQRLRVTKANNRYVVRTSRPGAAGSTAPPPGAGPRADASPSPDAGRQRAASTSSTTPPPGADQLVDASPPPVDNQGGSRTGAATPSRSPAATPSRTGAATCTESAFTESTTPTPPPTPPATATRGSAAAGGGDDPTWLAGLVLELQDRRAQLGLPGRRWTLHAVRSAVQRAVAAGYALVDVPEALRALASDPETALPGRLAAPGAWWDFDQPAVEPHGPTTVPHCGTCDVTRYLVDAEGLPIAKCPTCHPAFHPRPARSTA